MISQLRTLQTDINLLKLQTTTQEQEHAHQIDVLKTELAIKNKQAEQKAIITKDTLTDELHLKKKQQQNEFMEKEVRLQKKVAEGKESVRRLEDRINDDKKVVDNLKNMN